jgi:hypothetical protein
MSMHYFSMSVHYFSACLAARLELQEKEDDMFGESKGDAAEEDRDIGSAQELQRSTATPGASQTISSISSGLLIVGKIVAEELKISGRVEGSIHANRVQLKSTAVVAGDIFHRSLAVEENAQFEGGSRRLKDAIDLIARSDEPQPPSDRVDRHQR